MSGQLHAPAAVDLPVGNRPRYPLNRKLSEPQNRSGSREEEKSFLPLPGIELRFLDHPNGCLVAIPIGSRAHSCHVQQLIQLFPVQLHSCFRALVVV
jgi:hypothetical protein